MGKIGRIRSAIIANETLHQAISDAFQSATAQIFRDPVWARLHVAIRHDVPDLHSRGRESIETHASEISDHKGDFKAEEVIAWLKESPPGSANADIRDEQRRFADKNPAPPREHCNRTVRDTQ